MAGLTHAAAYSPRHADVAPTAVRLTARSIEKPWGRTDLAPWAEHPGGRAIGEIAYDAPGERELLIKALFTAERLSVQVHPDDAQARRLGLPRGKDEAWVVLAAERDAAIGLGLTETMDNATLAAAARDGSIEGKLAWHACRAGDVFFAPAGTIHAIGAGIVLIEVQQNLDLTYRLFDYGRDRELHVEAAVAAADARPWHAAQEARALGGGRHSLVEGPSFVLERWRGEGLMRLAPPRDRPVWLTIVAGNGAVNGEACGAGEVWLADATCEWRFQGTAEVLLAYPGAGIAPGAWTHA